ncbi:MAG: cytidine deaminase [Bacillota bacterium]
MAEDALFTAAKNAALKAYAPYSGFRVGAALLAEDGRIFTGCNVENASYGMTVCAERTVALKAVSEGAQRFSQIAIYAESDPVCPPCGACLQFLSEFGPDVEVIMINHKGDLRRKILMELLPLGFGYGHLGKGGKRP